MEQIKKSLIRLGFLTAGASGGGRWHRRLSLLPVDPPHSHPQGTQDDDLDLHTSLGPWRLVAACLPPPSPLVPVQSRRSSRLLYADHEPGRSQLLACGENTGWGRSSPESPVVSISLGCLLPGNSTSTSSPPTPQRPAAAALARAC